MNFVFFVTCLSNEEETHDSLLMTVWFSVRRRAVCSACLPAVRELNGLHTAPGPQLAHPQTRLLRWTPTLSTSSVACDALTSSVPFSQS